MSHPKRIGLSVALSAAALLGGPPPESAAPAPGRDSVSHTSRHVGLAWLNLPPSPPGPK